MKPGLFRSWSEAIAALVAAIVLGLSLWAFAIMAIVLLVPE